MNLVRTLSSLGALTLLGAVVCSRDATAAPAPSGPRAVLLGSEAGARGDVGAVALETLAAIEAAPGEPASAACARRLGGLLPYVRDVAPVERRLQALLEKGVADADLDEALRDLLERLADARGDEAASAKVGAARGYLRRFAVIGPFGAADAAYLYRRYAPEDDVLDPRAPIAGRSGDVRWTALPVRGHTAWVGPRGRLRQGGSGVVYAVARVRLPAARTVALKAWCDASFRVSVNGRTSILADRERDRVGDATWGVARIGPGWNRILVKVTGDASFALRMCDPATGRALGDVEMGDPLEGMAEAFPDTDPPEARTYRTPVERALEDADAEHAGESAADRAARLSLAAITADECDGGDDWDAYRLHEAAAEAAKDASGMEAAWIRFRAAEFVEGFRGIPDVLGRRRAHALHEAAVAALPGFVPSRLRLAEHLDRDDHPDQALKALEALLAEQPSATAELALARLAARRGWEREALAAARRALDAAPRLLDAQSVLEDADRRYGDGLALQEWTRRRLALNASDGSALSAAIATQIAEGKVDDALKALRDAMARWPDEWGWRLDLAQRLRALGRLDESLVEYRALAAEIPDEDDFPRIEGQILEEKGDGPGAVAAYRRSLALQAFQPSLWRAIARIEQRAEDFAAPYEPDVAQLLKALPSDAELREKHPKAVAVTVLDHCVLRVHRDGSASSIAHLVYKVLDEKGVAKYGDLPNRGECFEIRAILPDGRVMLPTGLGGRDFNIEGLVPGTVLEQRYLEHFQAGTKGLATFGFRFQDTDFEEEPNPVLLSRLVVLADEGTSFPVQRRRFTGEEHTTTKDGVVETVYEMRDVPRIEHERGMPPAEEIVPIVDLGSDRDFDDTVASVLGSRRDTRTTPALREAALTVRTVGMEDLATLKALYEFVNDTITNDGGSRRGPTATLLQRAGDREELFAALVRAAGIRSRVGRAMPYEGEDRDVAKRGLQAFTMPLLWLEPADAEPIPFVMGSRTTPFGLLPSAYQGTTALLAGEDGGEIVRLPHSRTSFDRVVRFDVALGATPEQAAAKGRVRIPETGGYDLKQRLQDMTQDARRKFAEGQIAAYLVGPTLTKADFPDLEDRGRPLEMNLEATMSGYLAAQGDGFVVPIGLPKSNMRARFVDRPERVYPCRASARDDVAEEVRIHLGRAWDVETLPTDHLAASTLGTYSLTFRREGDEVRIRRERHFRPAEYAPHEYAGFVDWCNEIDQAEDRKVEVRARR